MQMIQNMNSSKMTFPMLPQERAVIIQRAKYLRVQMNDTAYLLSGENDPIFAQHGSELMNEVFLKTGPSTDREMI